FARGAFTLTVSSGVAVSDGVISIPSADVLTLTITGGHLFAGIGGSLSGTTVSDGSVGISASGVELTLVSLGAGAGSTYTGLQLTAATAAISGIPGLTVNVSNAFVKVNKAAPAGPKLNWQAASLASYGLDIAALTDVSVGGTVGIDVAGFVFARGAFTLTVSSGVAVSDGVISIPSADVLTLTITGGHLFAGIGGSLSRPAMSGRSVGMRPAVRAPCS